MVSLPKREPILADLLLSRDRDPMVTAPHWHNRAFETLQVAKKFVLDAQAARYVAQMLREDPRIVADAQDFAIPPFSKMWIEMPFQSFFSEITGKPPDVMTGDKTVGYLFDGPVVKVASHGWQGDGFDAGFLPVEYVLHRPMSVHEELDLIEKVKTSRVWLDLWFWGESASEFIQGSRSILQKSLNNRGELAQQEAQRLGWDREGLRALRSNHTARLAPMIDKRAEGLWMSVVGGSAGDLRNIIALLLFLDRTNDIQTVRDIPHGSRMVERKPRPLMAHRVIALKLDPMPRLRRLVAGEGLRRRLHDVRGHYCHDKTARKGCPHGVEREGDFGEWWTEYRPLHWRCTNCGGERWWRTEHSRGSLDEGLVAAEYAVTR